MLDHPDAVAKPDRILTTLFIGEENNLPERLKIYRNNIVTNLTDALLATYPLIEKLTGEDFTTGLLRSYVLKNPPQEACLARYGAGLDAFINTFTPAQGLPYLPDVARLEWATNEAYYADDDKALTPQDLQNLPVENMSDLHLQPRASVRLLESRWPLTAIRDFCLNHCEDSDASLDLQQGGCRLMVYRSGLSVEVVSLEPAAYDFLQFLSGQKTLGEALENTLKSFPTFEFQQFLQSHLRLETLRGWAANTLT
jgi:hypothetical protein